MSRNQTYTNTLGYPIPARQWSDLNSQYKFGFNGKKKDNYTCVDGDSFPMAIGIMARIYDSRLGRWLSLDPMMRKYSNQSPFNYCINNPILVIDEDGRDVIIPCSPAGNGTGKHPIGHHACLISNNETGWKYYSYDIKTKTPNGNVYYGSLLYGKYVSARDAGNFVAGAVAQKSIISNRIIDYGYGTFNQNNNDVGKSLLQIAGDVLFFIMPDTHG